MSEVMRPWEHNQVEFADGGADELSLPNYVCRVRNCQRIFHSEAAIEAHTIAKHVPAKYREERSKP